MDLTLSADQIVMPPKEVLGILGQMKNLPDFSSLSRYVDLSPLIRLASKRPIEEFRLIYPGTKKAQSLSKESVQHLAQISSLRFFKLYVGGIPAFHSNDISRLIPENCWSRMVHLELEIFDLTESKLVTVLKAAPSLCWAWFKDWSGQLSPALMLAAVLHHSKSVASLEIDAATPSVSLQQVRDAFASYPLSGGHSTLKGLHMRELKANPDAFELMMRTIGSSPNLCYVNFPLVATSLLSIYSTRHLQALRSIRQFITESGHVADFLRTLPASDLMDLIELVLRPTVLHKYECRDRFNVLGEWSQRDGGYDEIIGTAYVRIHSDVYPVFHRIAGKQAFYDTLYKLLTIDQKKRVAVWEKLYA